MSRGHARPARADAHALKELADYKAAQARGEYRLLKLAGADLRDTDMSGLQLDECDLTGAELDGARFIGASLVRSSLANASLLGVDFSYADLDRVDMQAADATAAAFVCAKLRRGKLARCHLRRADLSDADLSRANLFGSDLTAANLSRALASQANLRGAILDDAVLTALQGEPLFDVEPNPLSPDGTFAWPAARLAEPQLVELAESYLSTQGWTIEPSSWHDRGIDLMAQREDVLLFVQVKATATPSSQKFTHLAQHLKRIANQRPNVHVTIVIPGPVPERLREVALANRVGVLGVWVGPNSMRVEEVVHPADDPLASSA